MDNANAITSEIIDIVPKASDTIIVYYAGHGVIHQKKLYLATKKTRFNKPQRTGAIESNDLLMLRTQILIKVIQAHETSHIDADTLKK